MIRRRDLKTLALPMLLLLSTSCGKWAKTNEQVSIDTVPVPAYPKVQDDVFSLTGKKPEITYRTTMLIIDEATPPALLAEVINASVFSREAFAAARNFEITRDYKNLFGDSGLEIQALQFMKKDLADFELKSLEKNPISLEAREANTLGWIEKEIVGLRLNPEQRANFDEAWGAYCEAKIVEWAGNSTFASTSYSNFPTPQPFCTSYYEAKALLQGPSCQAPAQGNYFRCLWEEGVLKTRWFQPQIPLNSNANAEDVEASTIFNQDMTKKRAILQSLLTTNLAGFQAVLALSPEKVAIQTDPVRNKVNANFFVSIFTQQLVKAAGNNVVWCSLPNFGIKDPSLNSICTLFSVASLAESPANWIDAMEGRAEDSSLVSLPIPASPRQATTAMIIRYVGERNKGKTSESDRLFHLPNAGSKTLESPQFEGAGPEFTASLDEIRSLLAPVLYGSFGPESEQERNLRLRNITYRQTLINDTKTQMKALEDQSEASINRGLVATNAGNVAHGFIEVRFHFRQLDQILLGEFWPKDSEISSRASSVFRGCFNVSNNQPVSCPEQIPGADPELIVFPADLRKDPNTGRIDFAMTISDPETASLVNKPRVDTSSGTLPNYFMDFTADDFRGRTLRFEIFPNRLQDYLDIMTGKVFLEEGSKTLYEGGISGWELWDI